MNGVCPKCFRRGNRLLVPHHIKPKKFKRKSNTDVLYLCNDCRLEIESLFPQARQLHDTEYWDITLRWLRGGYPTVR